MTAPLHDRDPTGRFSDRAGDYVRFRPTYPAAAIDAVFHELPARAELSVVDIGAGTGISSRLLADRGCRVTAVEPNAAMRAAAEEHPRVTWQATTAEATGLDAKTYDLVVCAQAFHWFQPQAALQEFHRVLRRSGRLALVWNNRDSTDPFTAGYREAILAVGGESEIERRTFTEDHIPATGLFAAQWRSTSRHGQPLTRDGLIGRAASASYVPKSGPALDELAARLSQLHAAHADAYGVVTLRYVANVYCFSRVD